MYIVHCVRWFQKGRQTSFLALIDFFTSCLNLKTAWWCWGENYIKDRPRVHDDAEGRTREISHMIDLVDTCFLGAIVNFPFFRLLPPFWIPPWAFLDLSFLLGGAPFAFTFIFPWGIFALNSGLHYLWKYVAAQGSRKGEADLWSIVSSFNGYIIAVIYKRVLNYICNIIWLKHQPTLADEIRDCLVNVLLTTQLIYGCM